MGGHWKIIELEFSHFRRLSIVTFEIYLLLYDIMLNYYEMRNLYDSETKLMNSNKKNYYVCIYIPLYLEFKIEIMNVEHIWRANLYLFPNPRILWSIMY